MNTGSNDIKKYVDKNTKENIYAIYYDGENCKQIVSYIKSYCSLNHGYISICTNVENTKLYRLSNINSSLPIVHEIPKDMYVVISSNSNISDFIADIVNKDVFENNYIELTEYIKKMREIENNKQVSKEKNVEKKPQKSTNNRYLFKIYEDGKPVIEYEGDEFPDNDVFRMMLEDKMSKCFNDFYGNSKKNKRIILS
jgi:hypothetical protein